MANFKIGQKVVAVVRPSTNGGSQQKGIVPFIKPNTIQEVKAICYCSHCGRQKIDVGLVLPTNINPNIECSGCGNWYPCNGRWFLDSSNFRPIQYDNISAEIVNKLELTEEKHDVNPKIKIEEHERVQYETKTN